MIEVEGLAKRFKKVQALQNVTFAAPDGQITGLLGPNGAGKTTALRIVYSVLRADSGTARVDGIDVAQQPREAKKRIGVLPHAHGLYPRLTPREHIRYYGQLQGCDPAKLESEIERLIELLDMGDIADRRTAGFSQGQKVKVAIARALVHHPENVILDEPTNGLDVMSTRAMRDFIRSLKEQGRCVLFSSHIMQEVSALCDRIVVLAEGRVVASGSPDEVCAATGESDLEEAFIKSITEATGSAEGLE